MTQPHARSGAFCPVCDSERLSDFFSARLPVHVGRLGKNRKEALTAPVGDIDLCHCANCGFIHNRIYDSEKLEFMPGYEVSLIHSPLFRSFTEAVARRLIERYDLRNKKVVEVGCGMGEFLTYLCRTGCNDGYGFDPTVRRNTEEPVGGGRIRLIRDCYSDQYADLAPDFLCSLSVLECIENPVEFVSNIRSVIGTNKTAVYFEVFNGARAISGLSTWSIHYESCNYWSLESLVAVLRKCRFEILDYGTCYEDAEYIYVEALASDTDAEPLPRGPELSPTEIAGFSQHHETVTSNWKNQLVAFADAGEQVAVWGTGGKGISFLNAVDAKDIGCVVDISPDRQGMFVPGSGHRILAPEDLAEFRPTTIIVTNPLYGHEIEKHVNALGLSCRFLTA